MKQTILFWCLLLGLLCRYSGQAQSQWAIYFERNQFTPTAAEQNRLQQWIQSHPGAKILAMYGSTDETGSTAANDTLAQKRVDAVYALVKGKVAIREDFKKISLGERQQRYAQAALNRNVTLVFLEAHERAKEQQLIPPTPAESTPVVQPSAPSRRVVTEADFPENIQVEQPDGRVQAFQMDRQFMATLAQAPANEVLTLGRMQFVVNTFAMVPESRVVLYELLWVLRKNPKLRLGIEGHLCCSPTDRQDLSTQRARAIYQFLVQQGIDKQRLTYKGLGTTQPLFPIPERNEQERAANRRVEVRVLENQ